MKRCSSLRILLALVLPLFFVVSACDSGGSGGDDEEEAVNHEFSFSITPTSSSSNTSSTVSDKAITEKDLTGYSFFVDTDDIEEAEDDAFVIYFSDNESLSDDNATQGLFGIIGRESGQPGSGEYTITDESNDDAEPDEFVGALYEEVQNSIQGAPVYHLNEGTLEITSSSDDRVSGTIDASGTAYEITGSGANATPTEQPVDITGSFTAKNLDTYLPFDQYSDSPSQ